MNKPTLSIYVPTYNHEDYIVRALDSILMQQTKYSYEVYVGEDCSTDNTRQVLKAWEAKHPGIFHILYREKNMYNSMPTNHFDLIGRCCGKYIICLEGDDYWTDPYKIDKQICFLEEHPEYIAVAHNCLVVGHDSEPQNEVYPQCMDEEYTWKHYCHGILPGQLTTVMYRNVHNDRNIDTSLFDEPLSPGDRVLYFWLLCNGRVHCIQEVMSAYRHVTDQGSSYSATSKYRFETDEAFYGTLVEFAKAINNNEALIAAQTMYFRNIVIGVKFRQCSFFEGLRCFLKIKYKVKIVLIHIAHKIERVRQQREK